MRTEFKIYVNEAMAATVTGPAQEVRHIGWLGFIANISGVATTGSLQLQAANTPEGTQPVAGDWVNVGSPVAMTSIGNYLLERIDFPYAWCRLVYTQAGGIGTLLIKFNGKGF